jgi:hypothetical protein
VKEGAILESPSKLRCFLIFLRKRLGEPDVHNALFVLLPPPLKVLALWRKKALMDLFKTPAYSV